MSAADEWAGWVCITGHVVTLKGNPSHLLLHEVAHCIRNNRAHDLKWRKVLTDLGAKKEADKYIKKSKPRPPRIFEMFYPPTQENV